MRVVMFYHSLISDWNHSNAHFLRGVVSELKARGIEVTVYEPRRGWSVDNLVAEYGVAPLASFHRAYPALRSIRYDPDNLDLDEALDGANLVLAHEWNDPQLIRKLGRHRAARGRYQLLFHAMHHDSATAPPEVPGSRLDAYDGVLAPGCMTSDLYRVNGWSRRAWVWHEAADVRRFQPLPRITNEGDLVWIGNWRDEERSAALREFVLEPVRALRLRARAHGARYPVAARVELATAGIEYAGWLPNYEVPRVFSRYRATVHVPRRPRDRGLSDPPTIRVFEALACGIPLISARWEDSEDLFNPGEDYLLARDRHEMCEHLKLIMGDAGFAAALAARGFRTIRERHTCAHRVDQLLAIYSQLLRPTGGVAA